MLRGFVGLLFSDEFPTDKGILCSGRTPPAFVPVEGSHTFLGLVPSRTALERGGVYIIFFDLVLAMIVTSTETNHPKYGTHPTTYVERTSVTTMLSCL